MGLLLSRRLQQEGGGDGESNAILRPLLELVVCGSSSSSMPAFGEWERVVVGHCYDDVDFTSCHAYYEEKGDRASFPASDRLGWPRRVLGALDQ